MVALSLLCTFPRIYYITYLSKEWRKVADAIYLSKQLVDQSWWRPV